MCRGFYTNVSDVRFVLSVSRYDAFPIIRSKQIQNRPTFPYKNKSILTE